MPLEKKHVVCSMCDQACSLEAHVRDGRLEKLRGYADHLMMPKTICCKPVNAAEWYYNEHRLKYPLKRTGERGSGQWTRITWEQAMDEIAAKLQQVVDQHGPEAFACSTSDHNIQMGSGMVRRFMNLLGSPNYISGVSLCQGNTAAVNSMTCGGYPFPDYEQTRCIVFFGHNLRPNSWAGEYYRLKAARARGAKLIVLDPRRSHCAKMADIHLQLRAGTDAAMSLGWINVIIEEELYDKKFVSRWCVGFDELKQRAKEYPLDRVSRITGVPANLIREAAIMYATNTPAIIPWTCATDQQLNSTSALRCQGILRALTNSLNVPGGDVMVDPNEMIISESELELHERLPQEKKDLQLGAKDHPVMTYWGQQALNEPRRRVWGHPYRNLMKGIYMAHPPAVFKAMREGVPYPVKAFFSIANNTLMCYTNQQGIFEAIRNLDLFVVNDLFMTPTAQLADYVLPGDCFLERPVLYNYQEWLSTYSSFEKAVEPPGECRDVYYFLRELAVRMGMEDHFPWKNVEELYEYRIQGTGLTWEALSKNLPFLTAPAPPLPAGAMKLTLKLFAAMGLLPLLRNGMISMLRQHRKTREFFERRGMKRMARLFRDYFVLSPYPHEKRGFATPSGKVELYSSVMESIGCDPLPYWKEIYPPDDNPSKEEYPLRLFVGLREDGYFLSAGRHVKKLRKRNPEPRAMLHTQTARKSGINDGDWIYVETDWGRIKMKAQLSDDIQKDLVGIRHGWWKPEMAQGTPELCGAWDYSDGVLLSDDPALFDPEQGLPDLRGGRKCRVIPMENLAEREEQQA